VGQNIEASVITEVRSVLFWEITQRIAVIAYRRFGTTCRSQLLSSCFLFGFLTLQDETTRFSRNVGKELPLFAT